MPKAKLTNTFTNKAKCPKDKTKIVYFDTTDTGRLHPRSKKHRNKDFLLQIQHRWNNTSKETLIHRLNISQRRKTTSTKHKKRYPTKQTNNNK